MKEQLLEQEHEAHDPKIDVDALWERDQEVVERIRSGGAQAYFKNLGDTEMEDFPEGVCCACIDERVKGRKLALPGSGILLERKELLKILDLLRNKNLRCNL